MGSMMVTVGSDPASDAYLSSAYYSNTYFGSWFGAVPSAGEKAAVAANTSLVGGPTALLTDDTTSYAHMDESGYNAAGAPEDRVNGGMSTEARQDSATTIPPTVTALTSVYCWLEVRSTASDGNSNFAISIHAVGDDGTSYLSLSSDTPRYGITDWQRIRVDPGSLDINLWRSILEARALRIRVGPQTPGGGYPDGIFDVGFLGCEFTWSGPNVQPNRINTWVRTNQRGDKFIGAPRTIQSNSQQASLRNIGFR